MKIHKLIDLLESQSTPVKELGLAITKAVCENERKESIMLIKAMDKHFQKKTPKCKKTSQALEKLFQTKLKSSILFDLLFTIFLLA